MGGSQRYRAGYLVRWGTWGHFLQYIPAARTFEFCAAEPQFATVFSKAEAHRLAAREHLQGRSDVVVVKDVRGREPIAVAHRGAA